MNTTYQGRTIEIIAPRNPYGACAFTVNGQGPASGGRFMWEPGKSAAECLNHVKWVIDEVDAKGVAGITGTPDHTMFLRPGSWEVCGPENGAYAHIKPVGHPCNETRCKQQAAKKARAAALRAERHPSAADISRRLAAAGFPKAADRGRDTEGFRVLANDSANPHQGIRVVWYAHGYLMPMSAHPGRADEIADFFQRADRRYAVEHDGGPVVTLLSKTHAQRP